MTQHLKKVLGPNPQSEPILGREEEMVENSAGGYVFEIDDFSRLRRFLILGSEGGSYYADERELTLANAKCVHTCMTKNPKRTLEIILDTTLKAPKNDTCLFAFAMMVGSADPEVRKFALQNQEDFNKIVRIGTHLFQFTSYVSDMRGWGRALRRAISGWYLSKRPRSLSYQVAKYRQRYNWSHRDILRKVHPIARGGGYEATMQNAIFNWVAKGVLPEYEGVMVEGTEVNYPNEVPTIIGLDAMRDEADDAKVIEAIYKYNLSWEMLPTASLKNPEVWEALLVQMPAHALLRNLGRMTSIGTLGTFKDANAVAIAKLTDDKVVQDDRVHPLHILIALSQYRQGKGDRGSMTWDPVGEISDCLDGIFDKSFDYAPQTGKRLYLGVDVSASMTWGEGFPGSLNPMLTSACIALAIARREPKTYMAAFCTEMQRMNVTAKTTLWDLMRHIENDLNFGGTDCAIPMLDALEKKIPVDCFVILTDGETWAGRIHPVQALQRYRREMGINAKLAVVAMTSTGFSLADPRDPGMLDIVGFDPSIPKILEMFVTDQV